MTIFQIHKDGKNVNGDISYPSLGQAAAGLRDAPDNAEVVEVDISGNIIRHYTAEESANASHDFFHPKI